MIVIEEREPTKSLLCVFCVFFFIRFERLLTFIWVEAFAFKLVIALPEADAREVNRINGSGGSRHAAPTDLDFSSKRKEELELEEKRREEKRSDEEAKAKKSSALHHSLVVHEPTGYFVVSVRVSKSIKKHRRKQ